MKSDQGPPLTSASLSTMSRSADSDSDVMPRQDRSVWRSVAIVATCTLAMIVNSASSSAASISLPTVGADLDIDEYKLQWVLSSYTLSSGCLLLLFGRLADLHGRKATLQIGLLFLSAFSLGCGFANDETTLDVLRGLQGVGGAAVVPAALGILANAFPPSRARAIAFSTFAAGAPLGAAVGTAAGGVLTQLTAATWRSVYFLIAGLGALCFVSAQFAVPHDVPSEEADRRVDWLGAFLVTAGLVLVVFVLSDGSTAPRGWRTPYISALLVTGVVLTVLFLVWQRFLEVRAARGDNTHSRWTPPPLMKPSIWTRMRGRMAVMLVIAFLEYGSFSSWILWAQLYYQDFLHLSPVQTMLRLLPMFVAGCLCNVIVALLVGRLPLVLLIVAGTALTATANLLFALIVRAAPYWAFGFPAAIVTVFGADFVFAAGTLFVAKISLPHEQSLAGALFQTMTQLGSAFGYAITTILFNATIARESRGAGVDVHKSAMDAPEDAQFDAYKAAMWGGFAFGILGALLAAVFLRHVGIVGHQKTDTVANMAEEGTAHVVEESALKHKLSEDSIDTQTTSANSEKTLAPSQ